MMISPKKNKNNKKDYSSLYELRDAPIDSGLKKVIRNSDEFIGALEINPKRKSAGEFFFAPERTITWAGAVNYSNFTEAVNEVSEILKKESTRPINLVVTSPGGQTGIAMSFYDLMKEVYRPNLRTIGSGDVDSSGVVIFLAGKERFITPHTTMLLHLAGRTLESSHRFTSEDISSMAREDAMKDEHYATLVAQSSNGQLTTAQVLQLMRKNTVLSAIEVKAYGLAHHII